MVLLKHTSSFVSKEMLPARKPVDKEDLEVVVMKP